MTRGILLSFTILGVLTLCMFLLSFIIRRRYSKDPDTPKELIGKIIEAMKLSANDNFVDLGAGDFRLVVEASKICKGTGIELSPLHVLVGRLFTKGKFKVIAGSFFRADLSGYNVIFANLDERLIEALGSGDRIPKGSKLFLLNDQYPDRTPNSKHTLNKELDLFEYQF